jgi:hypothetical protein
VSQIIEVTEEIKIYMALVKFSKIMIDGVNIFVEKIFAKFLHRADIYYCKEKKIRQIQYIHLHTKQQLLHCRCW